MTQDAADLTGSSPPGEGAKGTDAFEFVPEGHLAGFLTCLPIALGVGAYGLVFGVLAREAGLSVLTAVAMSATVLAGAAQLIAVGLWDWPIPIVAVVGTTLVVNLRDVLMGASLRPWFTRLQPREAYLSLFFMADENWALTIKEFKGGSSRGAFLLGSGLAIWVVWVLATAVGAVAGVRIGAPGDLRAGLRPDGRLPRVARRLLGGPGVPRALAGGRRRDPPRRGHPARPVVHPRRGDWLRAWWR